MSLRSEWQELKETVPAAYWKAMVKGSLLVYSGDIAELASDSWLKRDALPEPFDIADHIGNAREAAMVTMASSVMIGLFRLFDKPREVILKRAPRIALAGFAVSSAVQLSSEHFEFTNQPINGHNTGDMLDAAYGIGWSGLVAYGSLRLFYAVERVMNERREAARVLYDPSYEGLNDTPDYE